jgi:hypothetical protein
VLDANEWDYILPGYSTIYPTCFRSAIPYLLASLVYHQEWVARRLPQMHPLFLSNVWRSGYLKKLAPLVQSGYMQNPESGMKATGIPPYVVLFGRVESVDRTLCELSTKVDTIANQITHIPIQLFHALESNSTIGNAITEGLEKICTKVVSEIRNTIQTSGPFTNSSRLQESSSSLPVPVNSIVVAVKYCSFLQYYFI